MDRSVGKNSPVSHSPVDARRDIRLAAPADLHCVMRGAGAVLTMNNISAGGFGACSNMPLGRDTVYEFEFTLGDLSVVLRARVIHCAWLEGDRWKVGAAFEAPAGSSAIEQLIDRITGTALDFA